MQNRHLESFRAPNISLNQREWGEKRGERRKAEGGGGESRFFIEFKVILFSGARI